MITSEQVVKYLIKTDLDLQGRNDQLNSFGLATLVKLGVDKDIKGVTMSDVLDYIHIHEDKCKLLQKALTLAIKKLKKLGYAFGEKEIIEEVEK